MEYYVIPEYFLQIAEKVKESGWLIHNFKLKNESDLFIPTNYLCDEVSYKLTLDTNIFQYILDSVLRKQRNENYDKAISLVVFCQICEIQIEPNLAVYEKINYEKQNVDRAISDLSLFKKINNFDSQVLAKYALGYTQELDILEGDKLKEYDSLKSELLKYPKLENWDNFYLMVLALVQIYYDEKISNNDKLNKLIDWMHQEFGFSVIVVVFASILWSSSPFGNMMKFKTNSQNSDKEKQLSNMTWDFYQMNVFLEKWQKKTNNEENLFASADVAYREILKLSITIQQDSGFESLKTHVTEKDFNRIIKAYNKDRDKEKRVFGTENWTIHHRQNLITALKLELFA